LCWNFGVRLAWRVNAALVTVLFASFLVYTVAIFVVIPHSFVTLHLHELVRPRLGGDFPQVEKKIPFWPPIKEQQRHYWKIETENDLDYIARHVMRTAWPLVTLELPKQGEFVAKRFSILYYQYV